MLKAKDITEDGYYWRIDDSEKQVVEIDGEHWYGGKCIKYVGWDVFYSTLDDDENADDVFYDGPFAKRELLTDK